MIAQQKSVQTYFMDGYQSENKRDREYCEEREMHDIYCFFCAIHRIKNPDRRWTLDDLENNIDMQFG